MIACYNEVELGFPKRFKRTTTTGCSALFSKMQRSYFVREANASHAQTTRARV